MENNETAVIAEKEYIDNEWLIWCLISVLLSFFITHYYIMGTNFMIDYYQLPSILKTINIFCATPGFLLGGVLMISIIKGKVETLLQIIQLRNWRYYYIPEGIGLQIVLIFPLLLISISTLFYVDLFLKPLFPELLKLLTKSSEVLQTFAISSDWYRFAIFAIFAIILAPIVEEIVFRGVIFSFFSKYTSRKVAVLCTACMFAAFHLNALQFLQLFVLGVVFQILFIYHKSIYPCIIYHSINNAFAVGLLALVKLGIIKMPEEDG